MDPCFHVVAADCSIHGKFAVQARELASGQKDIKVIVGKTMIDIISVSANSPIEVRMDREPDFTVVKTEKAVQISAPLYGLQSLVFDNTHTMAIQLNPLVIKGHMCGLCGNFNMQFKDDIQGMAIPVVEFSREGYKIRKGFLEKNQLYSNEIIEFCKFCKFCELV